MVRMFPDNADTVLWICEPVGGEPAEMLPEGISGLRVVSSLKTTH